MSLPNVAYCLYLRQGDSPAAAAAVASLLLLLLLLLLPVVLLQLLMHKRVYESGKPVALDWGGWGGSDLRAGGLQT